MDFIWILDWDVEIMHVSLVFDAHSKEVWCGDVWETFAGLCLLPTKGSIQRTPSGQHTVPFEQRSFCAVLYCNAFDPILEQYLMLMRTKTSIALVAGQCAAQMCTTLNLSVHRVGRSWEHGTKTSGAPLSSTGIGTRISADGRCWCSKGIASAAAKIQDDPSMQFRLSHQLFWLNLCLTTWSQVER